MILEIALNRIANLMELRTPRSEGKDVRTHRTMLTKSGYAVLVLRGNHYSLFGTGEYFKIVNWFTFFVRAAP